MAKWKKSIAGDRNVNTNIEAEIEMETTLEVRWFFPGMPPAVVQRWFELDLPGKSLTTETRTDWYANLKHDDSAWLDNFSSRILNSEEVKLARPKGYRFAYAFEVKCQILIAKDLGYLEKEKSQILMDKINEVSRMITSLNQKLKTNN